MGTEIVVEKDRLALNVAAPEDFRDAKLYFGDYMRLQGLRVGDMFWLREEATGESKVVLVGNATPYNGVSSVSDEGWLWDIYNAWKVEYILHLGLERDGSWLHPDTLRVLEKSPPA